MENLITIMTILSILAKALISLLVFILVIKIFDDPYIVGAWFSQLVAGFEGVLK